MKPGMDWMVLNFCCSLATLVESAEPGRKDELSFFWTSASLLWKAPPDRPMNRMMMASAPKIQTNLGRGCFVGRSASGCRRWSVLVMHFLLVRRPKLSGTGDIRRWGFTPKRP